MTAQLKVGITNNVIALSFGTLAVGNAPGTLIPMPSVPSILEYRMPNRGSVVGMAANLSGTLATGTLTFYPTLNGSPMSGGTLSNGTINIGTLGNDEKIPGQQPGYSFERGDTIGLAFVKTGTVTPTTRDMVAQLIVLLSGYDF